MEISQKYEFTYNKHWCINRFMCICRRLFNRFEPCQIVFDWTDSNISDLPWIILTFHFYGCGFICCTDQQIHYTSCTAAQLQIGARDFWTTKRIFVRLGRITSHFQFHTLDSIQTFNRRKQPNEWESRKWWIWYNLVRYLSFDACFAVKITHFH